jgi:hypothetical protein
MGDNYKSDYLISFKGLDIFLDDKLDSPYKRAYVGIPKDKDDVLYAKRSNDLHAIEIANKWSIDEPKKRQYAFEKRLLYIEIYSCKDADDIENQLNMLYYAVKHKNPFVTLEDIENEYEYFKTLKYNEDLDKAKANRKNNIVKFFQFDEFYAKELELYAYNPTIRRKLIQNRIEYLFKPESEHTFSDMLYGFKKSGIHYTYSHFNPIWTNWFINRYEIKSVYDPCGGWGHHLLGMLSCDKIIYNDISKKVCNNINRMKKYLKMENLEIHNSNAMTYILKSDVDAFFMCPPYYNVETYETDKFQSLDEYKIFLNSIFDIWKQSSAKIFGIILREDFISLIDEIYAESYALIYSTSHFEKHNKKRFNDYFYIFKKNYGNEI